jgi:hypothetical protein
MLQQNVLQSLLALVKKELKSLQDVRSNLKSQMAEHYKQSIPGTNMGYHNYRLWHLHKVEIGKVDRKLSNLRRNLKELKLHMQTQSAANTWWQQDLPDLNKALHENFVFPWFVLVDPSVPNEPIPNSMNVPTFCADPYAGKTKPPTY